MTTHNYSLRRRVSSSSLANRTPSHSPLLKPAKPSRKWSTTVPALQLKHVIGTTTSTPSGLSCCGLEDVFAYCAGSVAVLARIDADDVLSYRYFKARPMAIPVNHTPSYYDSPSASSTPTRRRTTLNSRKAYDDHGSSFANPRDWFDDSTGQTWSARERIKTVSCVAISPDGKILVVGEMGYNPRVLLFSTSESVPTEIPLSIITDHTVGVRSVAFSPDSKFLATLGDINDGFLYIWKVNTKSGVLKLVSSNKCTTNVCDMTWCGQSVVTVGTRHIKIWQALHTRNSSYKIRSGIRQDDGILSPVPTTLHGRNCLLGPFADATFTAVVAVSEDRAVVCADNGHICLLDLSEGRTELLSIGSTDTPVAAISFRENPLRLVWAGGGGSLEEREVNLSNFDGSKQRLDSSLNDLKRRRRISRQSLLRQSLGLSPPKRASIVALGCFGSRMACIDANGTIRVSKIETYDAEPDISKVSSHSGLIRGVQRFYGETNLGSFFTWARNGEIHFWSTTGKLLSTQTVDLEEDLNDDDEAINELKVARYSPSTRAFVVGDQYGVIKLVRQEPWTCMQTVRAHSAEVNSIDISETRSLVATCGRDRMVQVFRLLEHRVELLQTLDDHISAVGQVLFSDDGRRLLSCSSDRTVVVRDLIERNDEDGKASAFISAKVITMKAAPLSMSLIPFKRHSLVVSTMDRHVVKIDLSTGAILGTFRVSDQDSDDTVNLNSICISNTDTAVDSRCLLVGYSATDKSVRLYDLEKGTLLGRDSGHTEGISDIVIIEDDPPKGHPSQMTLVSTGLDSTIMMWSATTTSQPLLSPQQEVSEAEVSDGDPQKLLVKASPVSLPPLRKILSKVDIAEYSRHSSPTRDSSPNGLRRKRSNLALTTSIEEAEENASPIIVQTPSQEPRSYLEKRSPSPPDQQLLVQPRKQRSRPELNRRVETKYSNPGQSPSPPSGIASTSSSTTPRHNTRANNSRLRRPPSVPNDLRSQATSQNRRQSVSSMNDFGSIGMATEQACRMLRIYGKKLQASKGEMDLEEIEADLESVLKTVRQKKASVRPAADNPTNVMKQNRDEEIDGLSTLLEKTSMM